MGTVRSSLPPGTFLTQSAQGKGKKAKQTMRLVARLPVLSSLTHPCCPQPSGEPATIKWITVGGRTSAYVPEIQKHFQKQRNRDGSNVLSLATPISEFE